MSDVIRLLPDSVANQIAAGEVIQRPASVVKELVENSVDAGATSIQIVLKEAGKNLIQIIDNGCGMSAADARLAFERHSTSKISQASDLFSLHTMGFRGEARASICAVAQVELRTQRADDEMGTVININGSKVERQEPFMYGKGTNFMIKNLFFNVPARRKFLKNNQVELSNILREFERLAIVNHEIEFLLVHNDSTLHHLLPGTLKQRISSLFGHSFDTQLIPVEVSTSIATINGFICKPENARKRNQQQFMFVNGRFMRHPYFHKAIMLAYEQLIPNDQQPNYFLNFTVEPSSIDVNIHPTKTEIKFENEQMVWQILSAAVKETLGKFSVAPSIDFDTEDAPDIPVFTGSSNLVAPKIAVNPSYNPFTASSKSHSVKQSANPSAQNWSQLYDSFLSDKSEREVQQPDNFESKLSSLIDDNQPISPKLVNETDIVRKLMQVNNRYIIQSSNLGLMLIDQNRAHTVILYNRFMSQHQNSIISSQSVLFPEVLHLSAAQNAILESAIDNIQAVGFEMGFLGNNTWSINAVPSAIRNIDSKDVILSVIDSFAHCGDNLSTKIYSDIALTIARKAAIQSGKSLSDDEMNQLVNDLFSLEEPNYTPDGKPVYKVMSVDDIAKMFS